VPQALGAPASPCSLERELALLSLEELVYDLRSLQEYCARRRPELLAEAAQLKSLFAAKCLKCSLQAADLNCCLQPQPQAIRAKQAPEGGESALDVWSRCGPGT